MPKPTKTHQEHVQDLGNHLFHLWEDHIYSEIAAAANSIEGVTPEILKANASLIRQVAVRCFALGVTAMAKHVLVPSPPLAGAPVPLPPAPENRNAVQ